MNNIASSPTSVIRSDGSSMVDYTNLYIKNLDLNVKSVDLFNNFRRFGRIISARVMKNAQTKQSKGFGFVSFSKADEAQRAKHEMNGEFILSKPVIVAFHEPKKAREADVSVSPTQSTFNGASRQQMVAASVSPHLVQHQQQHQYNRLSPPPPPTPSFTSSPSYQNGYEQKQQQQSNGNGYFTNGNSNKTNYNNNKNTTTRTRDSIDQRYGSNVSMPQQKYNNNGSSYQQNNTPSQLPPPSSNGIKAGYQPMERNNSNLSHHQHHQGSMGASNQYDQRQQQQQQQTNQVCKVPDTVHSLLTYPVVPRTK